MVVRLHVVGLLASLLACTWGGSASAEASLTGINLGTPVHGPKLTAADLTGRVVLFDYWGVHCPPCVAAIHHLAEMQAKYGTENLVIIANHCQGEPAPTVLSTWMAKGGGDSVSVVMDGELAKANVSGLPRCFLFGHDGKLLFDGSPYDVESKVDEAMKASPGALVAGHTFKKLSKPAAVIGSMKVPLAPTVKALRTAANGSDADAKSEAEYLLAKVSDYAQNRLSAIANDRATDPAQAMTTLNRMLTLLKGDELGKPFEDLAKELKADKSFRTELQAAESLASVCAQAERIGLGSDPDAKAQKQVVADIANGLAAVRKRFPETVAAHKADELAKSWGL